MGYKICLLANENPFDHRKWEEVIKESLLVEKYSVVNITNDDWVTKINEENFDLFLFRPSGRYELMKRLYDERALLIAEKFKGKVYPSLKEILIYENKRFLRDWLEIKNLPHPKTNVFFDMKEAFEFVSSNNKYPIVGKTNIGASGNGVVIMTSEQEVLNYIKKAFTIGIKSKTGPKLFKGSIISKLKKVIKNQNFLKQRIKDYSSNTLGLQFHYVILQEYIPHEYEWRCVRIGESYFAHKKLIKGSKASGSLHKGYDSVPLELLNFIRNITENQELTSVAIDVFEKDGGYLINEIQCFFGQSDAYQMLVDGKPGRYIYKDSKWLFEEGMFNTNECYDLRLEHAINKIL